MELLFKLNFTTYDNYFNIEVSEIRNLLPQDYF